MADRRLLTLRKTIMFYICIGNIFLLIGCAKTEMVSEDNTVTDENIVTTTGTITIETEVIETETQDAIQPSTDQPPEDAPEYKIIMVGDILLHTPVEESCLQPDGSYDYDSLFSHTKEEIAAADLALVNQEVIIGGADLGISGYPCFNADYSLCDSLVGAGFDVICHATNHAMDKGRAGLVNCAEYWRDEYPQITVLGIHDIADTSTSCGADPAIIELGDMRIAVLNYTYGTNGISLPADMPLCGGSVEGGTGGGRYSEGRGIGGFHDCMSPLGHGIPVDTRCLPGKVDESFCRKRRGSGTWDTSSCDRTRRMGDR